MPYPSEHSCRLVNPDQFDRFARKNGEQEHDGKKVDVIYGIKDGKSQIQALRYDKKTWTAESAAAHCKSHDGSFEAASKEANTPSKEALQKVYAEIIQETGKRLYRDKERVRKTLELCQNTLNETS